MLESLREIKNFDAIKSVQVKQEVKPVDKAPELIKMNCAYCGTSHPY